MTAGVKSPGRHASGNRTWHRFGLLVCLAWTAGIAIAVLLGAAAPGAGDRAGTRIGGAAVAGEPRVVPGSGAGTLEWLEAGRRWQDGGRPGDPVRA